MKKLTKTTRRRRPTTALVALAAAVLTGLAAAVPAEALYILTGVEDTAIVLDGSQAVPDLSGQSVKVISGSSGCDVQLEAGLKVTITRNGSVMTTESKRNESVSALLKRMDVVLSPLEMVSFDLSQPGTLELTVAEELICYEEITEEAPYETVRVANASLPKGTERVTQKGVNGVRSSIYEVVWSGGEIISRQYVEEVSSTAVNEIVEYGTSTAAVSQDDTLVEVQRNADGSGTLVFASGATLRFSGAKSMTATAYTAGHGGVGTRTATGMAVQKGVAAVDKSVIPLGTKLFIVTSDGLVYGSAVAADTGVKGSRIDLYHETYRQCIEFGRRGCTVYVLEG